MHGIGMQLSRMAQGVMHAALSFLWAGIVKLEAEDEGNGLKDIFSL
jgi:hypothetical protein